MLLSVVILQWKPIEPIFDLDMSARAHELNKTPRKLMFTALSLTFPTLVYWFGVFISKFRGNSTIVDAFFRFGKVPYYFVIIALPLAALVFLIRARLIIFKIEENHNNLRKDSEDLRLNNLFFFYTISFFFLKLFGFIL